MLLDKDAHKLAKNRFLTLTHECEEKHKGKYDYSKFVFKTLITKSVIICPIHGEFKQTMQAHLKGECPRCARETTINKVSITKEDFITMLTAKHPHLRVVTYETYKKKAELSCTKHPDHKILATPTSILRYAHGCTKCASEAMTQLRQMTQEEFELKVSNIHSNNITVLSKYAGSRTPIEFLCQIHEELFTKRPFDVLQGRGCNICGGLKKYRKYLEEPTILYYVYFKALDLYKVGITVKRIGIHKRFHGYAEVEVLDAVEFKNGKNAYEAEQAIIKKYKEYIYQGDKMIHAGNTELFTKDIMGACINNDYLLKCEQ